MHGGTRSRSDGGDHRLGLRKQVSAEARALVVWLDEQVDELLAADHLNPPRQPSAGAGQTHRALRCRIVLWRIKGAGRAGAGLRAGARGARPRPPGYRPDRPLELLDALAALGVVNTRPSFNDREDVPLGWQATVEGAGLASVV